MAKNIKHRTNDYTILEIADELQISYEAARKRLTRVSAEPIRIIGKSKLYAEEIIDKIR